MIVYYYATYLSVQQIIVPVVAKGGAISQRIIPAFLT